MSLASYPEPPARFGCGLRLEAGFELVEAFDRVLFLVPRVDPAAVFVAADFVLADFVLADFVVPPPRRVVLATQFLSVQIMGKPRPPAWRGKVRASRVEASLKSHKSTSRRPRNRPAEVPKSLQIANKP
jgi:hypothetical protein